jgi:hypothetical protein
MIQYRSDSKCVRFRIGQPGCRRVTQVEKGWVIKQLSKLTLSLVDVESVKKEKPTKRRAKADSIKP